MKISNKRFTVELTEKGGEIFAVTSNETGLQYMYQGDSEYWGGKNPTLFPIVGNTYDGTYEIKGKKYTFKNHGLIRYATLSVVSHYEDSLTFELKSNEETLKAYPFAFTYNVTYTLKDNVLEIVYVIKNDGNEIMPFTFGLHPGFKVPMLKDESFEDYSLDFDCDEKLEQLIFDENKEKPHYYEPVEITSLKLDYDIFAKYKTLIYKGMSSSFVTLRGPKHSIRLSIAGYPLLAVWTPKARAPFVCVEPWYSHADFEKQNCDFADREGMMAIEPGKTFTTSYSIEYR